MAMSLRSIVCSMLFVSAASQCTNRYGVCNDDAWKDTGQDTCSTYSTNLYCTPDGGYGEGWDPDYGTFETYAVAGRDGRSCPQCGCVESEAYPWTADDCSTARSSSTAAGSSTAAFPSTGTGSSTTETETTEASSWTATDSSPTISPSTAAGSSTTETETTEATSWTAADSSPITSPSTAAGSSTTETETETTEASSWTAADSSPTTSPSTAASSSTTETETETTGSCADNTWTDSDDLTCETYSSEEYCTSDGGYGPRWQDSWGTFEDYVVDGKDASSCPQCGCYVEPELSNIFTENGQKCRKQWSFTPHDRPALSFTDECTCAGKYDLYEESSPWCLTEEGEKDLCIGVLVEGVIDPDFAVTPNENGKCRKTQADAAKEVIKPAADTKLGIIIQAILAETQAVIDDLQSIITELTRE